MIIRGARADDSLDVLNWRNDPLTRAMSRTSELVEQTSHTAWFNAAISDPNRTWLIGEIEDQKIGMVRFDHGEETEVSININPACRGRGLGFGLLNRALGYARGPLVAEIKADNLASQRVFERAGFVLDGAAHGWRRYVRPAPRD